MSPIPHDFAERTKEMTVVELAAHYGRGCRTIIAWGKLIGGIPRKAPRSYKTSRAMRPVPADFADNAAESNAALMARYGCSQALVSRWRSQSGLAGGFGVKPAIEMPEDFREFAPGRSISDLARHYGRSKGLIIRFRAEAGITGPTAKPRLFIRGPKHAPDNPRDMSLIGRAILHLNMPQQGGWKINRCNEARASDPKGSFYRVGSLFLSADELLAMAEKKGFVAYPERMAA